VAYANSLAIEYSTALPAIHGVHEAWRYTLMSGVIPALPLIVVRPFLPESPAWQQKRAAGTLRRPRLAELFTPELRRVTIVTTLMMAAAFGVAFSAIQQMPRIASGIAQAAKLAGPAQIAANVQWWQEIGGLAGRTLLAVLALVIVSRQRLVRTFQIPGLLIVPLVFWFAPTIGITSLTIGMFFAGFFTVAQFSFWGNYLPRMYPTHLRGTGESFAANVGGRMLGTSFALVATTLASQLSGAPWVQTATAAAVVSAFVYVCGIALSFFLPEPKGEALPE
jgi:hypothetical protein